MPTYQYACTVCDHRFDAVQSFSDASLTVCPVCGGALRKVFSSVGIVFKGSGFYRTDSRSAAGSTVAKGEPKNGESAPAAASTSSSSESGSSSTSGSTSSSKESSGSTTDSSSSAKGKSSNSSNTPAAAAS